MSAGSTSLITEEEIWSKTASNADCTNILLNETLGCMKHVKYVLKHVHNECITM